jgi:hypothetical protein
MFNHLSYSKLAEKFYQALPRGNSRIGALVFGGGNVERIILIESTTWLGSQYDADRVESTTTSSTDFPLPRSMATSVQPPESPKCSCRVSQVIFAFFPPSPKLEHQKAKSRVSAQEADSQWTSSGKTAGSSLTK